jgi:hypothetical protein
VLISDAVGFPAVRQPDSAGLDGLIDKQVLPNHVLHRHRNSGDRHDRT